MLCGAVCPRRNTSVWRSTIARAHCSLAVTLPFFSQSSTTTFLDLALCGVPQANRSVVALFVLMCAFNCPAIPSDEILSRNDTPEIAGKHCGFFWRSLFPGANSLFLAQIRFSWRHTPVSCVSRTRNNNSARFNGPQNTRFVPRLSDEAPRPRMPSKLEVARRALRKRVQQTLFELHIWFVCVGAVCGLPCSVYSAVHSSVALARTKQGP